MLYLNEKKPLFDQGGFFSNYSINCLFVIGDLI